MNSFLRRSKLKVKRITCDAVGHDLSLPNPAGDPKFAMFYVYCRRCPFGTTGTKEELVQKGLWLET